MIFKQIPKKCSLGISRFSRAEFFSTKIGTTRREEDFIVFPREYEGNIYMDNWSLTNDGCVPTGNLYRNARLELLTSRLPNKVVDNRISTENLSYQGPFKLLEAGDNITHDNFNKFLQESQEYLSNAADLYMEDGAVIAFHENRIGVRVVSSNPVHALIARSLLISTPPRQVIPIARFDGWRFDPRYNHKNFSEGTWKDDKLKISSTPTHGGKGQRPICAYFGASGGDVAVQFVEMQGKVVGANIVVGTTAPISGFIAAIGHAASVMVNDAATESIALNSTVLSKGNKTVLVVNGNESLVQKSLVDSSLYGSYHNLVSADGVSAFWNGVISDTSSKVSGDIPRIESRGKSIQILTPNNMTFPLNSVVFFEDGAVKSTVTEDEALEKLTKLTDEKKSVIVKMIVNSGVKAFKVGNVQDINSLL